MLDVITSVIFVESPSKYHWYWYFSYNTANPNSGLHYKPQLCRIYTQAPAGRSLGPFTVCSLIMTTLSAVYKLDLIASALQYSNWDCFESAFASSWCCHFLFFSPMSFWVLMVVWGKKHKCVRVLGLGGWNLSSNIAVYRTWYDSLVPWGLKSIIFALLLCNCTGWGKQNNIQEDSEGC